MSRSAIGMAVLGLVLSGGGAVLAQPIPEGRPPEWGLAAGYGFDVPSRARARRTSAWPCSRRRSDFDFRPGWNS